MFILSIVCALKEGNYRAQLSTSQIFLNIGAFAAAAVIYFLEYVFIPILFNSMFLFSFLDL